MGVGSNEGVELMVLDRHHVTALCLKLPVASLDYYRNDSTMAVGLDMTVLAQTFCKANCNDGLTMWVLPSVNQTIVRFESRMSRSEHGLACRVAKRLMIPVIKIFVFIFCKKLALMIMIHFLFCFAER